MVVKKSELEDNIPEKARDILSKAEVVIDEVLTDEFYSGIREIRIHESRLNLQLIDDVSFKKYIINQLIIAYRREGGWDVDYSDSNFVFK